MKKMSVALMASMILLPVISFAQANPQQTKPQAPASWLAFEQAENAKRIAFAQQIKAEREAFLSSHPEAQAYLDQLQAAARARMLAWKAAHQK